MSNLLVKLFSLDNPAELAAWNTYARQKDNSFGYFGLEWAKIFQKAFGHPAYPLAALRDGKICGILPLTLVRSKLFGSFLVSMPFVNYGGILANGHDEAQALIKEASALRGNLKAKSVELRHAFPSGLGLLSKSAKVSMLLNLPQDPEILWKSFKDKVRNQVRKASKSGLVFDSGGAELLDDFYSVFCVNMRDLGTPVYSKKFFATVLETLPESTRVLRVMHDEKCIASGITYAYGDTMQMPWASSLITFRNMCPNHTLYWEALSQSCSQGFKRFDFGRSTPDSGPWRFKRQWGAYELPLSWDYILPEGEKLPELNVNNPKFSLAISAWKKLPLAVANTIGPRIVKCIP